MPIDVNEADRWRVIQTIRAYLNKTVSISSVIETIKTSSSSLREEALSAILLEGQTSPSMVSEEERQRLMAVLKNELQKMGFLS